ncbi:MAG TPA: cache domain-containing protein [Acidobacteriota bacterium]|nr:cache domain-containing protein [Acidobacteriota bacterium]
MRLSHRTTLLLGYTLVVALMGGFTIYAGLSFISETVVKEAKLKVQMDLNSAWAAYAEESALLQTALYDASQRDGPRRVLTGQAPAVSVASELASLMQEHGLDYLSLVDSNGVLVSGPPSQASGNALIRRDEFIDRALRGEANHGTVLLTREDLALESGRLVERAYIPLVRTERARPTDRIFEERGMALQAAVPIVGPGSVVVGAMYGGILLNRKFDLVDRIRDAVFGDELYKGKPLGTVTIFLWDVRIATNVVRQGATRAIGTRVSDEVYAKVLEKGERFGDRAFVVDVWYLSAYDPIRDPGGNTVGILYVGLLEQKYLDYKWNLAVKFLGISVLALLLVTGLAFYFSANLHRPILRLVEATRKLSAGKLDTRVEGKGGSLEMVELADSLNSMARSLEVHNKELQETSVALKKAYLEADERNRAYLEMLGFVTHELKSPLASIVFALESVRGRILGPLTEEQESVLKAASNSADYLSGTIANYLNLSRIEEGEFRLQPGTVPVRAEIIDPVIQRLAEMAADNNMHLSCSVPPELQATCDRGLMTSVFQNLLSNAIKYGKKGGHISIETGRDAGDGFLKFSILNEGPGFSPDEAEAMFTKFSRFGTAQKDTRPGTGLGLFVTRQIIEKHGGRVWAESEPGNWARFVFTIPA